MEESETVSFAGEVVRISDRFWGEGWGYGTIRTAEREVNIAGTLEGTTVGMRVLITGKWEDSKYGARVKIATLVADLPTTEDGVEQWLMYRLPQIGPIRAQDIADRYGDRLWDILENDYERLTEVSGITPERAKDIHREYTDFKDEREALVEYFSFGFTKSESRRIIRKLGKESLAQVVENPYILYLDVGGFSFNRTDHLAEAMKKTGLFGPRLVSAVVEAANREASNTGDTVFTEDELVDAACRIIDDRTNKPHLRAALRQAVVDTHITRYGPDFMLTKHSAAEAIIALKVLQITGALE